MADFLRILQSHYSPESAPEKTKIASISFQLKRKLASICIPIFQNMSSSIYGVFFDLSDEQKEILNFLETLTDWMSKVDLETQVLSTYFFLEDGSFNIKEFLKRPSSPEEDKSLENLERTYEKLKEPFQKMAERRREILMFSREFVLHLFAAKVHQEWHSLSVFAFEIFQIQKELKQLQSQLEQDFSVAHLQTSFDAELLLKLSKMIQNFKVLKARLFEIENNATFTKNKAANLEILNFSQDWLVEDGKEFYRELLIEDKAILSQLKKIRMSGLWLMKASFAKMQRGLSESVARCILLEQRLFILKCMGFLQVPLNGLVNSSSIVDRLNLEKNGYGPSPATVELLRLHTQWFGVFAQSWKSLRQCREYFLECQESLRQFTQAGMSRLQELARENQNLRNPFPEVERVLNETEEEMRVREKEFIDANTLSLDTTRQNLQNACPSLDAIETQLSSNPGAGAIRNLASSVSSRITGGTAYALLWSPTQKDDAFLNTDRLRKELKEFIDGVPYKRPLALPSAKQRRVIGNFLELKEQWEKFRGKICSAYPPSFVPLVKGEIGEEVSLQIWDNSWHLEFDVNEWLTSYRQIKKAELSPIFNQSTLSLSIYHVCLILLSSIEMSVEFCRAHKIIPSRIKEIAEVSRTFQDQLRPYAEVEWCEKGNLDTLRRFFKSLVELPPHLKLERMDFTAEFQLLADLKEERKQLMGQQERNFRVFSHRKVELQFFNDQYVETEFISLSEIHARKQKDQLLGKLQKRVLHELLILLSCSTSGSYNHSKVQFVFTVYHPVKELFSESNAVKIAAGNLAKRWQLLKKEEASLTAQVAKLRWERFQIDSSYWKAKCESCVGQWKELESVCNEGESNFRTHFEGLKVVFLSRKSLFEEGNFSKDFSAMTRILEFRYNQMMTRYQLTRTLIDENLRASLEMLNNNV